MNKINILENGTFDKVHMILYEYEGLFYVCFNEENILSTNVYETYDAALNNIEAKTRIYEEFIPKRITKITKFKIAQSLLSVIHNKYLVRYQSVKDLEDNSDWFDISKILETLF